MKSDDTDLFRMAGGMDRVSVQSSAVLGFVSFVFEPRSSALWPNPVAGCSNNRRLKRAHKFFVQKK
jgi:hypothetical protein